MTVTATDVRWIATALVVASLGCKSNPTSTETATDDAGTDRRPLIIQPIDISPLPMGVTSPEAFNYMWGPGRQSYDQAALAYRNKDWKAVATHATATIAADPTHLDAHRILASARAQLGEYARAIEHLRVALAGDFSRWGGRVLDDPELEPLMQSPLGPRVREMIELHDRHFAERARAGVAVVARRSPWKPPRIGKRRRVRLLNRAELFAFDPTSQRYLRLTQTGFQVAGILPSPTGDRIAFVTLTRVMPPRAENGWRIDIGRVGQVALDRAGQRPVLTTFKGIDRIAIEYRADGQLVAQGFDGAVPEVLGEAVTIDGTGDPGPAPSDERVGPRLVVGADQATLFRPDDPPGIAADWDPQSRTAVEFVIDSSNQRITVPSDRPAHGLSLAWSPDRRWLAFATTADPCHDQAELRRATLYVAEAETGRTLTVTTGAVRPWPRFIGQATVAFDDSVGVGIYDAQRAQEAGRLKVPGGVSVVGLTAEIPARCPEPEAEHEPTVP